MRDNILFVLFDLPVKEKGQRRDYIKFRKYLKKNGFCFIQKSVYVKHLRNSSNISSEIRILESNAPKKGNLISFSLSIEQFKNIRLIRGSKLDFNWICENIIEY